MYSLMERMDRHMTSFEAEYNKNEYLMEAIGAMRTKLYPIAKVSVKEDESEGKKNIVIAIRPLYSDTITQLRRLPNVFDYSEDSKDKNGNPIKLYGVSFSKYMPTKEVKHRKPTSAQSDANAVDGNVSSDTAPDNNVQSTGNATLDKFAALKAGMGKKASQPNSAPVDASQNAAQPQQAKKTMNKLSALAAARRNQINKDVDSSVLDQLRAIKMGLKPNAAKAKTKTATTTQANDTQSEVNATIMTWLKTSYMKVVDIIEKSGKYDPKAVQELKDLDKIYRLCMAAPTSKEKIYVQKTSKDFETELTKAINEGNWTEVLKSNIDPLNLEAMVFGNILSRRNKQAVINQARDYGFSPNDPNYPSLVMAPGQWAKWLNRRIKDYPEARYAIVTPLMSDVGTYNPSGGTRAHRLYFGSNLTGFNTVIAYDISDTEPMDPNDPRTDIRGSLPGIVNNLTGELNQAAIDAKSLALAAKEGNLSNEQKEVLKDIQTEDGQAKVFNRALMSYVAKLGIKLINIDETGGGIAEYANNVLTVSEYAVRNSGYDNPKIVNPLALIIGVSVGCYTIGADTIYQMGRQKYQDISSLKVAWKENSSKVMSTISSLLNYIFAYLNATYSPMGNDANGDDGTNNFDANAPVVVSAPTTNDDSAQSLNESRDYEFAAIERIINSL